MNTRVYILRVFDDRVEKPFSYKVFSKIRVGQNTHYLFDVNKITFFASLPDTNLTYEKTKSIIDGEYVNYTIYYSIHKEIINRIYLQNVRKIK